MVTVLIAYCPTASYYVEALAAAGTSPRLVISGSALAKQSRMADVCAAAGAPLIAASDPNAPAPLDAARALRPDLLLVAGAPARLGPAWLLLPRHGAINFHPSLLPRGRGRDPVFWTVLRGDPRAGVTAHRMTEALDAGPILAQQSIPVPPRATSASLALALDALGAALAVELLARAASGGLPAGAEQGAAATHEPRVRADHGLCDWARGASELERLVRACAGVTPAYTFHRGMKLVLLEADVVEEIARTTLRPGEVLALDGSGVTVATGPDDERGGRPGALRVSRWIFLDRPHDAPSLAALLGLARGGRLGSNPAMSG